MVFWLLNQAATRSTSVTSTPSLNFTPVCLTSAPMAQFPVPVGQENLPPLRELNAYLNCTVASDQKLVTVNKGRSIEESHAGFSVCEKCGYATTDDAPGGEHQRPYNIEFDFAQPRPTRKCDGTFRNVFLGHIFTTDLLLIRGTSNNALFRRW